MTISSKRPVRQFIIAPHVDDELIGCFDTVLYPASGPNKANVTVVYILNEEFTTERSAEAVNACRRYGVAMAALSLGEADMEARLKYLTGDDAYSEFYVPSRLDSHPFHREVTNTLIPHLEKLARYGNASIKFYSTDMNAPGRRTLNPSAAAVKRDYALGLYRSQTRYFEENAAATLFENVQDSDMVYTTQVFAHADLTYSDGDPTTIHLKSLGRLGFPGADFGSKYGNVLRDFCIYNGAPSLEDSVAMALKVIRQVEFNNPLISVIVKNEETSVECNV